MSSVLGNMKSICEAAQSAAFPGATSAINVAVSNRDGVDYQNNSAMALFGSMKGKGLPTAKSPRDVARSRWRR